MENDSIPDHSTLYSTLISRGKKQLNAIYQSVCSAEPYDAEGCPTGISYSSSLYFKSIFQKLTSKHGKSMENNQSINHSINLINFNF